MSRINKILEKFREKKMEQEDNDYLTYKAQGRYATSWTDPNSALLGNTAQQGALSQLGQAAQMHPQLASAYQQALAQSMVNTKNAAAQSILNNAFGNMAQQAQPTTNPLGWYHLDLPANWTFDELNDEGSVYNMPLQTAIDLAINKFGSRWFKDEETVPALEENREFWLKVMAKLFKAGHLQKETVSDFELDQTKTAWKIVDTDHAN